MDINFVEAAALAEIDRHLQDNSSVSPAQYEIIRKVIYSTADFEYNSLLKFSNEPLFRGYKALTSSLPIIVDVPEIQVSIVPRLQQTFYNSVYCCATTGTESSQTKTKAAFGLETLANEHNNNILVIGQDQTTLEVAIDLAKNGVINPSLAIATAPLFIEQDIKQYLKTASFPTIYIDSSKGGATVAAAIFNGLVDLAWRVNHR